MRVELDEPHEQLVQAAIAKGRAADPQAYVQSLIDDDATDQWIEQRQEQVENLLRDRLSRPGVQREPGDFDALHGQVQKILQEKKSRRPE